MDSETIGFMPATEWAERVRTKQMSPVEAMRALLDRIAAVEPKVNAFAYLAAEQAMDAARAAEQAVMGGERLGRLHGVPVTIKDLAWTKDMPTQNGSLTSKGAQPLEDTPVVPRLKSEGAIILGKTTTSEFGWKGVSESPLTGITHNPWKHGMNAGASSAGAGAASAAGFGPLHQGSDGAGSIRMPSHFCGVFGLKPSFGRVPYYPVGTGDLTSHMGPMTRTVADGALLLEVMAGPHHLDFTTLEAWPAAYSARLREGIKGARIAYSPDLGVARVDPDVAALVRAAVSRFSELGAHVEEVSIPWGGPGPDLIRFFWSAHMTVRKPLLAKWEKQMDPGLVACIHDAENIRVDEYQAARERKMRYVADIHRWFESWDFLLTPSVSVAAFPAEKLMPDHWPSHPWDWISWAEFSYPFNMSWNPAASVPCGFTADGLPVGLQIVGKRFDDLGVLQASAAFEAMQPWAGKRPAL
jgi:aspartyl-tRNA(Asn)/glutamyl-tRNA(Gln) amidotransferase subunit A